MSSANQFEKEPSIKTINPEQKKLYRFICQKVCEYFDFFDTDYMRLMAETELGYTEKECDAVDLILSRLPETLFRELTQFKTELARDNNIGHILGNSPLASQAIVEMGIKKKIRRLKEARVSGYFQNSNKVIPLVQTNKSDDDTKGYIEYWMKKLDLSPEEKQALENFRRLRDYLLYYLDLIEQPENREILLAEMADADGWLKKLTPYYINGRLPSDSESRLEHINFFAKLEGFDSKLSGKINGLKNISAPIDETNFEAEFEKLKDKEYLNREVIYKDFIGSAKLKVA